MRRAVDVMRHTLRAALHEHDERRRRRDVRAIVIGPPPFGGDHASNVIRSEDAAWLQAQ